MQDVADYVGDSLGLSRQGAATDAELIAFCGVHFMAETASILSPEKTVLIPDLDAGCSLADSITPEELRAWQAKFPGQQTVMYVNTTAEIKALTDYCCTSANAVQVVKHVLDTHGPDTPVLFGPDMWLGAYVEKELGRQAARLGRRVPRARRHPPGRHQRRCAPSTPAPTSSSTRSAAASPRSWSTSRPATSRSEGVHMLSTGGMLKYAKDAQPGGEAIVATETGMLYPLQMAAPDVDFIAANEAASCRYMKMITLTKLRDALRDLKYEVKVPEDIARARRIPIERMVAIG